MLLARALFAALDKHGIQSCVVGLTEELPERISSDLDIIIQHRDYRYLHLILIDLMQPYGCQLVQVLRHEDTAWYYVIAGFGVDGRPWFLHLDFCCTYREGGRRLLEPADVLARRQPAVDAAGAPKGFWVAAPDLEFTYYLLKKVEKQDLDDVHATHLSRAFTKDPMAAQQALQIFWPHAQVEILCRAAASGDWSAVRAALPSLRWAMRRQRPLSLADRLAELRRMIGRVLRPTGLWVVVLGPDGSGKSSVSEHLRRDLAPAFRGTELVHLCHLLAMRRGSAPNRRVDDPHGKPGRGLAGSLAKIAICAAAHVAGHWLKTWPALVRSTLVTFDRYYHDVLVDPRRYRYGGPTWLARLAGVVVPRPDLWIILDAPPAVLQSRKREVSAEETARQRNAYRKLGAKLRAAHIVDASRPLAEVVRAVEEIVLNHLAQRMLRRLD